MNLEYDDSYNELNFHLNIKKSNNSNIDLNDPSVYNIERSKQNILFQSDIYKNIVLNKWKFSEEILDFHKVYFKKMDHEVVTFNPSNLFILNAYYNWGSTYYHFLTEVLPSVIYLTNKFGTDLPLFIPKSSFCLDIISWFNIQNQIIFTIETGMNINYIKQKYIECGNPSFEKIQILRSVIDKKVLYEKKYGIYIKRSETIRSIINTDEVFEMIKLKYNHIEWKIFDRESISNTINLFSKACIIVGPHGAGLTNMIFAPINIPIIEFMPISEPNICYWHLSSLLDNIYYTIPIPYYTNQKQLYVDIDLIKNILP